MFSFKCKYIRCVKPRLSDRTKRSACPFRFGNCGGSLTHFTPRVAKMSWNSAVNAFRANDSFTASRPTQFEIPAVNVSSASTTSALYANLKSQLIYVRRLLVRKTTLTGDLYDRDVIRSGSCWHQKRVAGFLSLIAFFGCVVMIIALNRSRNIKNVGGVGVPSRKRNDLQLRLMSETSSAVRWSKNRGFQL